MQAIHMCLAEHHQHDAAIQCLHQGIICNTGFYCLVNIRSINQHLYTKCLCSVYLLEKNCAGFRISYAGA